MTEEKLAQLSEKVDQLIDRLATLQVTNQTLASDNQELRSKLIKLEDELKGLKLKSADQSQAVKSHLTGVLSRLTELEQIGQ